MTALSVGASGNQLFRVPMWDVPAQRSATGGYPWRIEGNSSTFVYLKNATDQPQDYTFQMSYEGGFYVMGLKTIGAHQTTSIDVRALRDCQVPDVYGKTIPLTAERGQVVWSVHGTDGLAMIGRSEQVDVMRGVSSSYACMYCCGNSFSSASIEPAGSATTTVGGTVQFTAKETDVTCYGAQLQPYPVGGHDLTYTSHNPVAATINQSGTATGVAPGSTGIDATWTAYACSGFYSHSFTVHSPTTTLSVSPPQVSVDGVGFTGDYLITKWLNHSVIDNPDGSSPTWKRTGNPDNPVAYTNGANPTMFATLSISPSVPSTNASIRVKKGSTVIATKSITISGSSVRITGITTTSASESTVKTTTPSFDWEISYDGGSNWISIGGTGPHKIYWTYGAPLSPPFTDDTGFTYAALYDLALQKACGYSNGASTLSATISNINSGVDDDTRYNPGNSIASLHPLSAYDQASGVQCSDETDLLRGLLRSIGIDGTVLFIWAGPDANTLTRYTIGTTGLNFPSFRLIRVLHDTAPSNPHFSFHAVVSSNGTWYDPSYGLSYSSLTFNETANNNTPQQVHSSPSGPRPWSSTPLSSFVCNHTGIGGDPP